MGKYRIDGLFNYSEMDLSDTATGDVTMTTGKIEYSPDYESQRPSLNVIFEQGMERQRIVAEHQRLKTLALEAARTWHKNDKGFTRIALRFAIQALMEYEEKHIKD